MKQENEILLQDTLLRMLKRINKLELEQREILRRLTNEK